MNNVKLISVIIPVYNAENTIENSVKSVLLSTYRDIEIILVDDGSTDQSPDICERLAKKHENIIVYHNENGGAAKARNFGIEHANGQFISFIDSDDFITNSYYEILINLLNETDSDIAVCGHKKVYGNHKDILEHEIINSNNNTLDMPSSAISYSKIEALNGLLYQRNFISAPWGMLSKKELFSNVRFPAGKRAEDMATIYKLFAAASKVVRTDAKLYLYFQNKSGTIYTTQSSLNPDYYDNCTEMLQFIEKNYPESVKAAKSRLFSACFQILSETPSDYDNKDFINKLYDTVKNLRFDIILDNNGKPRNRVAALLSIINIKMLHKLLNNYYIFKLKRL